MTEGHFYPSDITFQGPSQSVCVLDVSDKSVVKPFASPL